MRTSPQRAALQTRPNEASEAKKRKLGASVLAGMLMAACLSGPDALAAVNEKSARFHDEAMDLLGKGEVNAAVIRLKNAVREDPDNLQARVDLARLFLIRREGEAAETEIRMAIKRGGDVSTLQIVLAEALLLQGRHQRVIRDIVTDLPEGAAKANAHAMRAQARLIAGDLERAGTEVEASLAAGPQEALPLVIASRYFQRKGEIETAIDKVEEAIAIDPAHVHARLQYGDVLRLSGATDNAIEVYTSLLTDRPLSDEARLGRAVAHLSKSDLDTAMADAEIVLERDPESTIANYVLATRLSRLGEVEEANERLTEARDLTEYPPALFLDGAVNLALKRPEQARVSTERFLFAVPGSAAGNALLAAIHLEKEEAEEALKILEPLNTRYPDDLRVRTLLSSAYAGIGRLDDAADVLSGVVAQDPDNLDIRLKSAQLAIGAGRIEEGVAELELLARGQSQEEATTMLVLANLQAGRLEEAKSAVETLKTLLPDNPLPYDFASTIALARGDEAAARRELSRALDVDPGFHTARLNLARLDIQAGDGQAARRQYQTILRQDPKNAKALVALARLADSQNDPVEALDYLQSAVNAQPGDVQIRTVQARYFLRQGRIKDALGAARKLTTDFPRDVLALQVRAEAERAAGLTESTLATYRAILQVDPDLAWAHYALGQQLLAEGAARDAARAFDAASDQAPDSLIPVRARLDAEVAAEGLEAAAGIAGVKLSRFGDPDIVVIETSRLYARHGKPELAAEALQAALAKRPASRNLMLATADTLRGQGAFEEALGLLTQWLETTPDDQDVALLRFSTALVASRLAEAAKFGEALVAQRPSDPALRNNLAWTYDQLGFEEKALEEARRAYALDPAAPVIADTLGWILYRQGDKAAARELLEKAALAAPDQPEINYHYAVVLADIGRKPEARARLERVLAAGQPFAKKRAAQDLLSRLGGKMP
ncbi:MAG: XrtA/PEP-CTERM system TPR-repeat protein PrsT [Pseudomonadota bacterium]